MLPNPLAISLNLWAPTHYNLRKYNKINLKCHFFTPKCEIYIDILIKFLTAFWCNEVRPVFSFEQLIGTIILQLFIKFEQNTYLNKNLSNIITVLHKCYADILWNIYWFTLSFDLSPLKLEMWNNTPSKSAMTTSVDSCLCLYKQNQQWQGSLQKDFISATQKSI